jgi:hypothetical protein
MGLFSRRMKDPVVGTAQVVSASAYRGDGIFQMCHMTLVIQAEGVEPFSVEKQGLVHNDKWPFPGMTVPVKIDRANPSRYELLWDEVESHRDSARRTADALAASLRGEGGTAADVPADLPPEAAAIVGQLEQMFPDATIVTSQGGAGATAAGGDEGARLLSSRD